METLKKTFLSLFNRPSRKELKASVANLTNEVEYLKGRLKIANNDLRTLRECKEQKEALLRKTEQSYHKSIAENTKLLESNAHLEAQVATLLEQNKDMIQRPYRNKKGRFAKRDKSESK